MKAAVYNAKGTKVRDIELSSGLFEAAANPEILRAAIEYQRARQHRTTAHTKRRSERRGGGRKPWKQKGTGNARQGSRRSPQWRKGGVVFGPRKDRNFTFKMNRKERRTAFLTALSLRAQEKEVVVLEALPTEGYKTKPFAQMFAKLPVSRKTLLVLPADDEKIRVSVSNLPTVTPTLTSTLNVLDVISHKHLVITEPALKALEDIYVPSARKSKKQ